MCWPKVGLASSCSVGAGREANRAVIEVAPVPPGFPGKCQEGVEM